MWSQFSHLGFSVVILNLFDHFIVFFMSHAAFGAFVAIPLVTAFDSNPVVVAVTIAILVVRLLVHFPLHDDWTTSSAKALFVETFVLRLELADERRVIVPVVVCEVDAGVARSYDIPGFTVCEFSGHQLPRILTRSSRA